MKGAQATVLHVRDKAAEVLAAVGMEKLQQIALFRAKSWTEVSKNNYFCRDYDSATTNWMRACEWLRIGRTLPLE
jgi:hypothetical protein